MVKRYARVLTYIVAAGCVAFLWACGGGSSGDRSCDFSGLTVAQAVDSGIPVTDCPVGDVCQPLTAQRAARLENAQVLACGDITGVCVGDGCDVGAGNQGGANTSGSFNPDSSDNSKVDSFNDTTTTTTTTNPVQ